MQQTQFQFEIVIGDDASTDGTREICNSYKNSFPELITLNLAEVNQGILKNNISTLKMCRGKYIAMLEGDDYWTNPLKLQNQTEYLERHDEVSLVHTNWDDFVQETKTIFKNTRPVTPCKSEYEENPIQRINNFMVNDYYGTRLSSFFFRKEDLVNAIAKDSDLFLNPEYPSNDIQIVVELLNLGRFHCINESMVCYRILNESKSISTDIQNQTQYALGCLKVRLYLIKKYNLPDVTFLNCFNNTLSGLLSYSFSSQNLKVTNDIQTLILKYNFKLSMRKRILLLGSKNKIMKFLIIPIIITFRRINFIKKVIGLH
jgi:glycosyltransferase involved in cell wall biosynthesis